MDNYAQFKRDKEYFESKVPEDIKRLIKKGIELNWDALVMLAQHDIEDEEL